MEKNKIAILISIIITIIVFLTLLPVIKGSVDNFECPVCEDCVEAWAFNEDYVSVYVYESEENEDPFEYVLAVEKQDILDLTFTDETSVFNWINSLTGWSVSEINYLDSAIFSGTEIDGITNYMSLYSCTLQSSSYFIDVLNNVNGLLDKALYFYIIIDVVVV